jgi:hypothetical protein
MGGNEQAPATKSFTAGQAIGAGLFAGFIAGQIMVHTNGRPGLPEFLVFVLLLGGVSPGGDESAGSDRVHPGRGAHGGALRQVMPQL